MVLVFSGSDRSGALVARASWQACAIPARVFDSSHRADLLRNLRAGMVSATGLSFLLDDQLPALRANRNLARIRRSALSQKTGALELVSRFQQSGFCLRWSRSCAAHRAWPHDVVERLTKAFAFYTGETYPRISEVLEFAKARKDGRYLVEVLPNVAPSGLVRSDSLALNAYLGAQGNQTISIVYREASPNSSFFNAELNAFSVYRENFGISSALLSDLDFVNQPFAQHIKQLQFAGVRYLIIGTPQTKAELSRQSEIVVRHDIGDWTIFEIQQSAAPIRTLQYRPALVVSDFTVKMRRRNQYDFIRLAEEQFNDAWFDVLLVRSPERRIDLLAQLDQFGALILDVYDYQDEAKALAQLKNFAQNHTLILLSSDAPFFNRVKTEVPQAIVIERPRERLGDWITTIEPSEHYEGSSIRKTWQAIRGTLDREKAAVASSEQSKPTLIAQTFHPKWVRSDNQSLYAATPFFTFGFFDQSPSINFQRSRYDRMGLWCSVAALVFLGIVLAADLRR